MTIKTWPNARGFDLLGDGIDTEVQIFSNWIGVRNNLSETWLVIPTTVEIMGRKVGMDFSVASLPTRCAELGQPLE